jgi:hypothetical protein
VLTSQTRRLGVLLPAVLLTLLSVFASDSGSAFASPTRNPEISAALTAWSHFPVHEPLRPLVLIDDDNVNAPALGFPDDATKTAFEDGAIAAPQSLPIGPQSANGFPLISAQAAIGILRVQSGPPAATPLTATTVTLGTGIFETDRGRQSLPAWLFRFQNIFNPAQVLAVSPRRIFRPPARRLVTGATLTTNAIAGSALLAPGMKTITVVTSGAPAGTGPCTASYSMRVGVSSTAIAVAVHVTPHLGHTGCLLQASFIHLTTKLSVPLDHRVVVDALTWEPMPVTRSSAQGSPVP